MSTSIKFAPAPTILTDRLRLREWKAADLDPFAALNADPRVMEYFEKSLSRSESDLQVRTIQDHFCKHGFGLWAVESLESSRFIGIVGLWVPTFEAHFIPCIEIGWRLAVESWGRGFATEAAKACLEYAFRQLRAPEVVSYTVPHNLKSRAVMEKLGMKHQIDGDFDHPKIFEGHPLKRHVLYRIRSTQP